MVCVIVAHIHKNDRIVGQQLQDLHGKGCVTVRLTGIYHRLLRAVPIVRVVAERSADTLSAIVPAHLIVTFDPDKIIVMLSYDLLYGLIMPNLKLELFRRKLRPS